MSKHKHHSKHNEPVMNHEQVAIRAYGIYVDEGCQQGRDLQHWLDAEKHEATEMSMINQSENAPHEIRTQSRHQDNQ